MIPYHMISCRIISYRMKYINYTLSKLLCFKMGSQPNDNLQPTSSKRNNTEDTEVFDVANDDRIVDDGK